MDIKALRNHLGLTQDQFAQLLRVTRLTVQRWETKKTHPAHEYQQQIRNLMSEKVPNETLAVAIDVRKVRDRLRWTQRQLAEHLGVAVMTVKRWEKHATVPTPEYRLKLGALATSPRSQAAGRVLTMASVEAPAPVSDVVHFSLQEAAAYVGCSEKTLREHIKKGTLPAERKEGDNYRAAIREYRIAQPRLDHWKAVHYRGGPGGDRNPYKNDQFRHRSAAQ